MSAHKPSTRHRSGGEGEARRGNGEGGGAGEGDGVGEAREGEWAGSEGERYWGWEARQWRMPAPCGSGMRMRRGGRRGRGGWRGRRSKALRRDRQENSRTDSHWRAAMRAAKVWAETCCSGAQPQEKSGGAAAAGASTKKQPRRRPTRAQRSDAPYHCVVTATTGQLARVTEIVAAELGARYRITF